jgi:hypothetical protein
MWMGDTGVPLKASTPLSRGEGTCASLDRRILVVYYRLGSAWYTPSAKVSSWATPLNADYNLIKSTQLKDTIICLRFQPSYSLSANRYLITADRWLQLIWYVDCVVRTLFADQKWPINSSQRSWLHHSTSIRIHGAGVHVDGRYRGAPWVWVRVFVPA